MLYNMSQVLSQVAQRAGTKDTNGNYAFDDTTYPTSGLAVNFFNDSIREICGSWDYRCLEQTKSYPFLHNISGVQSLYVSGNSGATPISGMITPYPHDVLNFTWTAVNNPTLIANGFSGVTFIGTNPAGVAFTGVSTTGTVTTATLSGTVGYVYQLDQDIDKFLAPGILIQNTTVGGTAAGVICQNTMQEDIMRLIPIGAINASGTPSYFWEAPGMSDTNNKAIQFFPFPAAAYSGQTFTVPYKKRHVDLTDMNQQQNMIPEAWQQIIVQAVLEKVFDISSPDQVPLIESRKNMLINQFRIWDALQPSIIFTWRDYNYNSRTNSAYDNSTWLSLGDNPGGR